MKARQSGFTLIEIAIVLIIIGVLLGGILKGQEMITQSKIRNLTREIESMSVAVLSYKDRYKSLPGDDDKADGRWTGADKGNGNGTLDGDFDSSSTTDESLKAWNHLRRAGFVAGSPDDNKQPMNTAGGIIGLRHNAGQAGTTPVTTELGGPVVCLNKLPGKIAAALDTQLDDGTANKGQVKAFDEASSNANSGAAATAYSEDSDKFYTVCRQI